jgi:hypothetical protein
MIIRRRLLALAAAAPSFTPEEAAGWMRELVARLVAESFEGILFGGDMRAYVTDRRLWAGPSSRHDFQPSRSRRLSPELAG